MQSLEISTCSELHDLPLFVAIEVQANRPDMEAIVFNKSTAEQLLAHLAADLSAIEAGITKTAITLGAALYDQSQLLRPGLPLFKALSELLESSFSGQQFQPRLLAFGAHQGKLPQLQLQPDPELPVGSFQLIPLQLSGRAKHIEKLAEQLEHQFLEQGQLSPHSAQWLQEELKQQIIHARFMTLNDLLAMLYLQLETMGLEETWDWIEKMLYTPAFSQQLEIKDGPKIQYHNTHIKIQFQSFDQWARQQAEDEISEVKYLQWLNRFRQSALLLQAHGLSVELLQNSAGGDGHHSNIFCEVAGSQSGDDVVIQHQHRQLGLIAVSVLSAGQQLNYYPLDQNGLADLHTLIKSRYRKDIHIKEYNGLCLDADGCKLGTNIST